MDIFNGIAIVVGMLPISLIIGVVVFSVFDEEESGWLKFAGLVLGALVSVAVFSLLFEWVVGR